METIVVIDDDEPSNVLLKMVLKDYRVITARTAEQGIQQARDNHPSLILMDIKMPGMDGAQATRIIKSDPALSHIPVIVVTATQSSGDLQRVLEAGCDDCLSKPFIPNELKQVVRQYLEGVR